MAVESNEKNSEEHEVINGYAVDAFIKAQIAQWDAGNPYGAFPVFLQSPTYYNRRFIGTLNLSYPTDKYDNISGHSNAVEVEYCIDAAEHDNGYEEEMMEVAKNI